MADPAHGKLTAHRAVEHRAYEAHQQQANYRKARNQRRDYRQHSAVLGKPPQRLCALVIAHFSGKAFGVNRIADLSHQRAQSNRQGDGQQLDQHVKPAVHLHTPQLGSKIRLFHLFFLPYWS